MKKKYFACAMGLVLALSLAACGEEDVVVEDTNEEVTQEVQTQEVQTQEVAETPAETTAEAGTEAASQTITVREPVPFDIDNCTIYLWGMEE